MLENYPHCAPCGKSDERHLAFQNQTYKLATKIPTFLMGENY